MVSEAEEKFETITKSQCQNGNEFLGGNLPPSDCYHNKLRNNIPYQLLVLI